MSNVLRFPDRSLLKLIDAVNGVIDRTASPAGAFELAETVMRDMGAIQDAHGEWYLPADGGCDDRKV